MKRYLSLAVFRGTVCGFLWVIAKELCVQFILLISHTRDKETDAPAKGTMSTAFQIQCQILHLLVRVLAALINLVGHLLAVVDLGYIDLWEPNLLQK